MYLTNAVEVKSGSDGFLIKMRDGKNLRCVHNNPHGGLLPDYAPHPAMVLKIEDGSGLLLPIIVCIYFFISWIFFINDGILFIQEEYLEICSALLLCLQ